MPSCIFLLHYIYYVAKEARAMNVNINQLIDYFAYTNLTFVTVFPAQVTRGHKDSGRVTAPHVSGLVLPLAGKGIFSIHQTAYTLQPGTLLHAPAKSLFEVEAISDQFCYMVVHITSDDTTSPFATEAFSVMLANAQQSIDLAKLLLTTHNQRGGLAALHAKALFYQLIEMLCIDAKVHASTTDTNAIEQAVHYIHTHYASAITVAELAETCQLERRRFTYLFEQHTGLNPSTYLTEYRISRAKSLLLAFNSPITQIAERVGYPDSFYFSRVFKKVTGMSPSQFRNQP